MTLTVMSSNVTGTKIDEEPEELFSQGRDHMPQTAYICRFYISKTDLLCKGDVQNIAI